MNKPSSIHFVGIKGVGMTPLAIIAQEAGITVTGSDVDASFITDVPLSKAGIEPMKGFSPENVGDVDLVITTNAHGGFDNPEVLRARKKNIPVLTKGEAVGAFMEGSVLGTTYKGIAVSGTHGKTTTSAMLATIGIENGSDPAYLIGTSEIPSLQGMPGHFGTGAYFIAEADEYVTEPKYNRIPQFMHQKPKVLIITNIDHDHPDVYETIDDVRQAFVDFATQVPPSGMVILCGDGTQAKKFRESYTGNVLTYGFSPLNDFVITHFTIVAGEITFTIQNKDISLGRITLRVGGEHNALNATAALLAAREIGISFESCVKALKKFSGTKRRMEYVGKLKTGAVIYDDYAHHPTEIISSLKSLKQLYPEKHIICIFQPHTYSRTKQLFDEFAAAFGHVDQLILLPIFASAREGVDPEVSSELLVERIKKHGTQVQYLAEKLDVVEYIDQNRFDENTVIVTMGAGDVYQLLSKLDFAKTDDDNR